MIHLADGLQYFMYRPPCDMRKSFNGLCGLVQRDLDRNPESGEVFIFINRRRDRIKIMQFVGDGMALYYKCLEKGTYELPVEDENGNAAISRQALMLLLEGVELGSVRQRTRWKKPA